MNTYTDIPIDQLDKWIEAIMSGSRLSEQNVKVLCDLAKNIFVEEPNVLELPLPITVCGDIHGQLPDLLEIFRIGGHAGDVPYLFLGDYVDRGFHSVEVITLILLYKVRYPNYFFALCGNHENAQISQNYGFYSDCVIKYGDATVFNYFIDVFCYMPITAIIGDSIFAVHGGLSPSINTIDQIRSLNRFNDHSSGCICDLLWSDPADTQGWKESKRGTGYEFGSDVSNTFVRENDIDTICRGHQLVNEGYNVCHDGKVITVFSAPNYCYYCKNKGSILVIDENNRCIPLQYGPAPRERNKDERSFFANARFV